MDYDEEDYLDIYLVTTYDNPYDPYEDLYNWRRFDRIKGYCTEDYYARITHESDMLSDFENSVEAERAIDSMIKYTKQENGEDFYIKIHKRIKLDS